MEQVQTHEQARAFQQHAGEQRIPMSYDEYLATFDDSTHAEWVDGEAIVFMPPNTRHQRIVGFLHLLIGNFLHIFGYGAARLSTRCKQPACGTTAKPARSPRQDGWHRYPPTLVGFGFYQAIATLPCFDA